MKSVIPLAAAVLLAAPAFAQAVQPYQHTRAVNSATCPSKQCLIVFPPVPVGKRLVLASISAQIGTAVDVIVLEGNGPSYFVPRDTASGYLSRPITLYFDAGSKPVARIFAGNSTGNTSFAVTLVGYLVPAA